LLFLLAAIPFYWLLVICFEYRLFDLGRWRNRSIDTSDRMALLENFEGHKDVDPDVRAERDRVVATDASSLPVRVN